ncbi:oligosaccharide flippase family protein [Sediminibacterium sp.]|uniref:oligosaccharide flippase family protein n=1 Tax=Sediminibacterium sp. TaxID=1917865 RepID=UPI003F723C70
MANKPKSLFTNAIWNIITVSFTALAGFVLVPLILNKIGTENFGIYTIILMIGGFAQLQSLGLGEATLKYVSYYFAKKDIAGVNKVFGATLSVYIFSGILISGLIVIFSSIIISWFKLSLANIDNAIFALRIAGITFFVSIFSTAFKTIPEALQRYDILSKYNLIMMVFRYTGMYLIAILGGGIIGLTILTLSSAFVDILVYGSLSKKLLPALILTPNFNKDGIKEVFGYGIFSFINELIQRASNYIDQLILALFFSASSVAYLNAPKDLITKAQSLTGAAGQALFPRFSSMEEGLEMQELYVTSLWVLTILSIIIFVPLAIVIPSFLSLWLSREFAENSSTFATLFSFGVAFNGGTSAYFALLKGTGRVKWLTKIISSLTLFSTIATAFLVYKFGINGSGIRILLFSWVGSFLCLYVGKKVFKDLNISRVSFETTILPVFLSFAYYFICNSILSNYIIDNWIELFGVSFILVLGIILLQLVFNFILFKKSAKSLVLIRLFKGQISFLLKKIK